MAVMESGSDATPETVAQLLEALTAALADRGLIAEIFGTRMVWAKNGAADPPAGDPRAPMSPGLRQTVVCQRGDDGLPVWFWVWTGPTREAAPELEYLCAAEHIDHAADRIARVLCLDGLGSEPVT
jgi:hypothetical protein